MSFISSIVDFGKGFSHAAGTAVHGVMITHAPPTAGHTPERDMIASVVSGKESGSPTHYVDSVNNALGHQGIPIEPHTANRLTKMIMAHSKDSAMPPVSKFANMREGESLIFKEAMFKDIQRARYTEAGHGGAGVVMNSFGAIGANTLGNYTHAMEPGHAFHA